jgi:hypothetical protein
MMNQSSWLAELAQFLHNNTAGVYGNTPTANIFLQQLPDSPVLAIGLFATGGQAGVDSLDPLSRPYLQCLVRRTTNIDGLRYATLVFNIIDNKWNITPSFNGRLVGDALPGSYYLSSKGYPVYTLNFSGVFGRKD